MIAWFALPCLFVASLAAPPMVMVPGFSNSLIEMKLDNADLPILCNRDTKGEWVSLWPQPHNQTALEAICWLESFKVSFNSTSKTFSSKKGISTRTVDFGGFSGMQMFPDEIVPGYVDLGWVVGKTLFGAPYDWRVAPCSLEAYFVDLQHLIEKASQMNANAKVVLFSPSLGPQLSISFLHRMTQEWKDKYIEWFIAESPVWSGTMTAADLFVAGFAGESSLGSVFRAIPTAAWLFPRAGPNATIEWPKDEPIFKTPSKNYSAYDFPEMLKDAGHADFIDMAKFLAADPDLNLFAPPGVNTFVTFGMDVNTTGIVTFDQDLAPHVSPNSTSTNTSGDGLVPMRSSLRGTTWAAAQKSQGKRLLYQGFAHQAHAGCLYGPKNHKQHANDTCFQEVTTLLLNGTIPPQAQDLAALSSSDLDNQIAHWLGM